MCLQCVDLKVACCCTYFPAPVGCVPTLHPPAQQNTGTLKQHRRKTLTYTIKNKKQNVNNLKQLCTVDQRDNKSQIKKDDMQSQHKNIGHKCCVSVYLTKEAECPSELYKGETTHHFGMNLFYKYIKQSLKEPYITGCQ